MTFRPNTTTCSGLEVVTGTAPIVSDTGTRDYAGLHGTFHLTISINEVEEVAELSQGRHFAIPCPNGFHLWLRVGVAQIEPSTALTDILYIE